MLTSSAVHSHWTWDSSLFQIPRAPSKKGIQPRSSLLHCGQHVSSWPGKSFPCWRMGNPESSWVLEQESQHKDTLQVTEACQYRESGLVHNEDAVYRFFMFLEKQQVHLLNNGMLRIEGANMVEEAYRKLKENNELQLKWQECFNSKDCEEWIVRVLHNSMRTRLKTLLLF